MKRQGFEEVRVGGKRPRGRSASASQLPASWGLLFILAYGVLLAAAVWLDRLPPLVFAVVAGLSLLAFLAYALDKHAARAGRWRTKESTLHLFALAGGWPGAWAAQRLLRHKSSKRSFLLVYRATVALHCAAVLAWVFWLRGMPPLL